MRLALVVAAGISALIPQPASANPIDLVCTVREVGVYANRVHVFCTSPSGGISFGGYGLPGAYFAVEIDSPLATNLVTIASDATVSRRDIAITFDDDPGANPAGCLASDCRRLVSVKGFAG